MRIVIINGSHRKNGATAIILNEMYEKLKRHIKLDFQINLKLIFFELFVNGSYKQL